MMTENDMALVTWFSKEERRRLLTYRERTILAAVAGIDDFAGTTHSLASLGRYFKVSRERVRQVLRTGLLKLEYAKENASARER